ncbi:hypothetical protein [Parafrankia elaeagni]|uniref:hypothetical protein n=1 Tax=Parafrankia elaeagni TaxID=222534 RepID=UPI0003746DC1|nr:hypothetical protein [Parafrankia elaeagni]
MPSLTASYVAANNAGTGHTARSSLLAGLVVAAVVIWMVRRALSRLQGQSYPRARSDLQAPLRMFAGLMRLKWILTGCLVAIVVLVVGLVRSSDDGVPQVPPKRGTMLEAGSAASGAWPDVGRVVH